MTLGDTPFYAAAMIAMAWATSGKADGIAAFLMEPYTHEQAFTCLSEPDFNASVIGPNDGLYALYLATNQVLCGAQVNPYWIAGYVPNDPDFHFALPKPLPPAPVPLPAAGLMMVAAIASIYALKGLTA